MLVLSFRVGETLYIGDDVTVIVNYIDQGQVSLGITAPREIEVDRGKVRESKNKERNK